MPRTYHSASGTVQVTFTDDDTVTLADVDGGDPVDISDLFPFLIAAGMAEPSGADPEPSGASVELLTLTYPDKLDVVVDGQPLEVDAAIRLVERGVAAVLRQAVARDAS